VGDSGVGLTPRVVGSAYSNNFDGTGVTTLLGIDSNRDVLVMQGGPNGLPSPNGGVLTTIGAGLGFNTSDLVGFDISGITDVAFASLAPPTGGAGELFTIDLTTGAATLVGTIGNGLTLTGLAADVGATPTVPEPSNLALLAAECVDGVRPAAEAKSLALTCDDPDARARDRMIEIDKYRVSGPSEVRSGAGGHDGADPSAVRLVPGPPAITMPRTWTCASGPPWLVLIEAEWRDLEAKVRRAMQLRGARCRQAAPPEPRLRQPAGVCDDQSVQAE
jgi:hypothetical protein